MREKNLKDN